MTVLFFLVPGAILGLIAWVVIGFMRSRSNDAFTLATATAFYARVLMIVGALMSLIGLGVVFKALFAYLNLAYSYYGNIAYAVPCAPTSTGCVSPIPDNSYRITQRSQDLVLGLTLFAIGLAVAVAHFYLARALSRLHGGAPAWLERGTLLALTVTTALGAVPSLAIGLYQLLTYFIIGSNQNTQPFGEAMGAAIAFVPAWLFVMRRLLASLRHPALVATPPPSSA